VPARDDWRHQRSHLRPPAQAPHWRTSRQYRRIPTCRPRSRRIITGLLREHLGFDGVVFTDDLNMGAIQAHYPLEQSVELCVTAGADVVLHANVMQYDPGIASRTVAILRQLVESGRLSEARVEQSYQRITGMKRSADWRDAVVVSRDGAVF
jgi:beta-glucosidase-like glycosyl hydrolase